MSQFGRNLFSGTPWMFWVLAPVGLVCAFLFSLVAYGGLRSGDWKAGGLGLVLTLGCLLLVLASWGRTLAWAGRVLCGMVAVGYFVYLVYEWGWDREAIAKHRGRGAADPINATLGFIVIGVPCALYAVLGRFSWKREEEVAEDLEGEEEWETEEGDEGEEGELDEREVRR